MLVEKLPVDFIVETLTVSKHPYKQKFNGLLMGLFRLHKIRRLFCCILKMTEKKYEVNLSDNVRQSRTFFTFDDEW